MDIHYVAVASPLSEAAHALRPREAQPNKATEYMPVSYRVYAGNRTLNIDDTHRVNTSGFIARKLFASGSRDNI